MQRPFRWDDLAIVAALTRAGSLSGAASMLGVNASTVSRRLDGFEETLGVRLFDRLPDGVAATEAAEKLVPIAEMVEHAAADVWRVIEGLEREAEGVVRLTAPPGVASQFVAPLLPLLYRAHPRLRVVLDASIGYADLTRREADLALRLVRPTSGDLVATRLATSHSGIFAASELARDAGTVRDLDALTWIDWGPDLEHLADSQWLRSQVDPERVVLRTSSIDCQVAAARAGVGAVVMPAANALLSGLTEVSLGRALRRRLPPYPEGAMWLVGHRALRHVPRIAALWSFLEAQGRAVPGAA